MFTLGSKNEAVLRPELLVRSRIVWAGVIAAALLGSPGIVVAASTFLPQDTLDFQGWADRNPDWVANPPKEKYCDKLYADHEPAQHVADCRTAWIKAGTAQIPPKETHQDGLKCPLSGCTQDQIDERDYQQKLAAFNGDTPACAQAVSSESSLPGNCIPPYPPGTDAHVQDRMQWEMKYAWTTYNNWPPAAVAQETPNAGSAVATAQSPDQAPDNALEPQYEQQVAELTDATKLQFAQEQQALDDLQTKERALAAEAEQQRAQLAALQQLVKQAQDDADAAGAEAAAQAQSATAAAAYENTQAQIRAVRQEQARIQAEQAATQRNYDQGVNALGAFANGLLGGLGAIGSVNGNIGSSGSGNAIRYSAPYVPPQRYNGSGGGNPCGPGATACR